MINKRTEIFYLFHRGYDREEIMEKLGVTEDYVVRIMSGQSLSGRKRSGKDKSWEDHLGIPKINVDERNDRDYLRCPDCGNRAYINDDIGVCYYCHLQDLLSNPKIRFEPASEVDDNKEKEKLFRLE